VGAVRAGERQNGQSVRVDDGGRRVEVASTYRVTGRRARRAARWQLDDMLVDTVQRHGRVDIEVEGGRLRWWTTRWRLKRRHGIVASRRCESTWTLRHKRGDTADEGDFVAPGDYERLTGISKESYEQRLLTDARASMMGEWTVEPDDAPPYTRLGVLERGSVDEVRLESAETEAAALVVLLRSDDRPNCVFGWRIPIWPVPAPNHREMGTPEGWGYMLSLDLVDLVEAPPGLPACDPDAQGITWILN
jgi:hypothetical protein